MHAERSESRNVDPDRPHVPIPRRTCAWCDSPLPEGKTTYCHSGCRKLAKRFHSGAGRRAEHRTGLRRQADADFMAAAKGWKWCVERRAQQDRALELMRTGRYIALAGSRDGRLLKIGLPHDPADAGRIFRAEVD